MQYFFVTYETRDGEHEYLESGVLSAPTVKEAKEKAREAKRLFERPGWEEFCEYNWMREISVIDFLVLKKYTLNIDRYFEQNGELGSSGF